MRQLLLALLATLGLMGQAFAWNGFGHIEVAAVAWAQLTPQTRERVDELCLAQIEMSREAPDRNVTDRCWQSGGGRARSSCIAQSPSAARERTGLVDMNLASDVEHVAGLIVSPGTIAPFGFLQLLALADHRQQRSEALVVDDGGLLDVTDLVEGPIGEIGTPVADG